MDNTNKKSKPMNDSILVNLPIKRKYTNKNFTLFKNLFTNNFQTPAAEPSTSNKEKSRF